MVGRWLPVLSVRPTRPAPSQVEPLVELFKAMADEHRLTILALLAQGELCICHLVELLDLPQSTVSRQVGLLKRAGLVQARPDERDQRWTYYRLTAAAVAELPARLAELLGPMAAVAETAGRPAPPCPVERPAGLVAEAPGCSEGCAWVVTEAAGVVERSGARSAEPAGRSVACGPATRVGLEENDG